MEKILAGCEGCLIYSDDIVVYGSSKEQHDERLAKVMKRLKDYNVTLNQKKCVFGVDKIEFIGHQLSADGIRPRHDKIAAIKNFRQPSTMEEVRSFLGLVNYVGKFIPNLATITEPLRRLTRNDIQFIWNEEQQHAFDKLKRYMTKESTLGYYNVSDRTQIIADASPVGLGAVLIQFKQNEPRIISYASRSLNRTEQKYAQTEKEALALVYAVERFHFYIFGREFELVTDHKALETIFSPKAKPCARIERWVLRLQSYRYKVIYKPGKTNIADPLSRLVVYQDKTISANKSEQYVDWVAAQAEPKAIKLNEISSESLKDQGIQMVKGALNDQNWVGLAKPFKNFETELCFNNEILLRGTRIVMPASLISRTLQLAHEGHPGMSVMKRRLRAKVWWPKIDDEVEEFVKKCKGCTLVSAPSAPEPMRRTELPSEAWQHIAIDFLGPLPSGHHLFVVVDYYSRFIEIEVMTKIDSIEAIKRLKVIFARFGNPLSIKADNGRQLISAEFKNYCEINNIRLIHTIPYWPQMNGEVERQNRSILKRLSISQEEKRNWKEDLQDYLLMYRSTPHSTTLRSPAELMFNRKIRDKLPSMQEAAETNDELKDRDKIMKEKGKEYADAKRHAMQSDIVVGDEVLVKRQISSNKLATTFEPTIYKVVKRNGPDVTVENTESLTQYRRNIAHIKKFICNETTDDKVKLNSTNDLYSQPSTSSSATSTDQNKERDSRKRKHSDSTNQRLPTARYPKRNVAAPKRFNNFHM